MWLDRLNSQTTTTSGASTPGRPYSPLLRRPAAAGLGPYLTSQRPGAVSKGPTSSLISNDSSGSLLGASRRANGSSLKQTSLAGEDEDSFEVLGDVVGARPDVQFLWQNIISEDDLYYDFVFGGLSLRNIAGPFQGVHDDALWVQNGNADRARFERLHQSIQDCDSVLNSVETNLSSFRNDLANVSADIESLQARSENLNVRLENRTAVEKILGPVVEELSVSSTLISKIIDGPIEESWIKALGDVDRRATAYHANSTNPSQSRAWADLGPLLQKLIAKASERIRDFFVAQIKALRSPHINAQIIQQQSFLRFSDLFAFLHKHHAALADDICQAYMNTMRWYYSNLFSRYEKALDGIKLHTLDKNDLIGCEDMPRKSGVLSGARPPGPPHEVFNLGRRTDMLKTADKIALPSYLAEEERGIHYVEVPFRNFNLALIDNAAAEYTFQVGFFSPPYPLAVISRHFNYILDPTFNLGQNLTKSLVADSFDGIGILICVRLTQQLAFELQRRKVPAMDGYINSTNMLLWPRLQVIMDRHCESLRQLSSSLPLRAGSRFANDQARQSAAPHLVTQRFGQLVHGILTLSSEAGDDEPIITSLHRLRSEIETFLARYSQANGLDRRKHERFLYNNYSLVLTIISDVNGKLAEEERDYFERRRNHFKDVA